MNMGSESFPAGVDSSNGKGRHVGTYLALHASCLRNDAFFVELVQSSFNMDSDPRIDRHPTSN